MNVKTDSSIVKIQLIAFEMFKNYINSANLSPEEIIEKGNKFSNWIVNRKRLCFFGSSPEEVEGIEKLDNLEIELNKFIKEAIIRQTDQLKRK